MKLKITKDAQFIGEAILLGAIIIKYGIEGAVDFDSREPKFQEASEYLKQGYEVGEEEE